ncbi:hypothetical protein [Streptomyces canus]|uniref:hypothetical protein n=1 Tax=Streptomyces canus TaxID=58343 RepID=UPI00278976A6|nr:hypothetical protein [Streptomyces canus]MDQ1066601.1 cytochrome P450 [Streptomyces canus]
MADEILLDDIPDDGGTCVHVVADLDRSREVLDDSGNFRIARFDEYVPGLSKSFFLAADMTDGAAAARCHKELAAYLAPARMPALIEAFGEGAREVVSLLPQGTSFDIVEECLRPYGRRVACALGGVTQEEGSTLLAALRYAAKLTAEGADEHAIRQLQGWVWNRLHVAVAAGGPFDTPGLPRFALDRGNLSAREIALLTMPLFEMAAYGRNTSIAHMVLSEMHRGRLSTDELHGESLRSVVSRGAALVKDLVITRVARNDTVLHDVKIQAGDRVLVDVVTANRQSLIESAQGEAKPHLAFGWGAHTCIARELSLQIAEIILTEIASRGTLTPVSDAADDREESLRFIFEAYPGSHAAA